MKKSNIAYFCMSSFGHVDWGGLVETLQILKRRGHEVSVASGPALKKYIQSFDLSFVDLGIKEISPVLEGETIQQALDKHQVENFFNFEDTKKAFYLAKKAYSKKGLDLIVSDCFFKPAQIMERYMDIPRITIDPQIPPSLVPPEMIEAISRASEPYRTKVKDFLQEHGISSIDLNFIVPSDKLNISFSTHEFDGSLASPARYVGASSLKETDSFSMHLYYPKAKKVFYSSGTLFWSQKQINTVLDLAERNQINLFVGGARILPKLKLPPNVRSFSFAKDSKIFPYMDAIISQGGAGTAIKAIRAGRPLIVIPLIFANYAMAEKVNQYRNGVGIMPQDFCYATLEEALKKVLTNFSYSESARCLQNSFEAIGGSEKAADLIENFLK